MGQTANKPGRIPFVGQLDYKKKTEFKEGLMVLTKIHPLHGVPQCNTWSATMTLTIGENNTIYIKLPLS